MIHLIHTKCYYHIIFLYVVLMARIVGICSLEYNLIPPPPLTAKLIHIRTRLVHFANRRRQAFNQTQIE